MKTNTKHAITAQITQSDLERLLEQYKPAVPNCFMINELLQEIEQNSKNCCTECGIENFSTAYLSGDIKTIMDEGFRNHWKPLNAL